MDSDVDVPRDVCMHTIVVVVHDSKEFLEIPRASVSERRSSALQRRESSLSEGGREGGRVDGST